ncbi:MULTISPECIES: DsrE family protein [Acidianus]|nr:MULTISPECIES: DsrE family protein [Acidianus]NON63292.1 hypothetical protein [Acidianus sp. RZ1]
MKEQLGFSMPLLIPHRYKLVHNSYIMAKILFLLMDEKRLPTSLVIAKNSLNRYEDVKVIILGEALKALKSLDEEGLAALEELQKRGAIDSACFYSAEKEGIKDDVLDMGITLAPIGERMAKYINQGYVPLTF